MVLVRDVFRLKFGKARDAQVLGDKTLNNQNTYCATGKIGTYAQLNACEWSH